MYGNQNMAGVFMDFNKQRNWLEGKKLRGCFKIYIYSKKNCNILYEKFMVFEFVLESYLKFRYFPSFAKKSQDTPRKDA